MYRGIRRILSPNRLMGGMDDAVILCALTKEQATPYTVVDTFEQAASRLPYTWHVQGSSREADMGTSTNRPKPKSGQSAARNANGKPSANQEKTGAAEPIAKTTTDTSDSSAKSTSGALSSTSKTATSSGTASATAKTSTAKSTARPTTTNAKAGNKAPSTSARLAVPPRVQTTRRDQKREELSRKIEERRQQREREQRNRRIRKWSFIGIGSAIGVVLIGVLIYNLIGPGTPPYLKGDTIDNIQCDALEQTQTHYHAHLQVYVNGAEVPIPGDVGRQSVTQCYYWLHVHSDTGDEGVIHIESPDNRTYDLKQFFDIWGQTLSATNLMGHKIDANHKLTVYVYNPTDQPTDTSQPFTVTPPSNLAPYTGDPTQITLKPHELIVLEYGTPLVPPPAFTFLASE